MTATRSNSSLQGGASWGWLSAYLVFFFALSLAKAPQVLIDTRFWAEEGRLYFQEFQNLDLLRAMLFVANGNYQFLTNLLAYVATKVPLLYAPAVTTYAAYLVELLVVLLIYVVVARYGISRLVGFLLVAAWTLMPARYEAWSSATNVQWICSISTLLILLLPSRDVTNHFGKIAVWTALCGLTGVPSCMLAPGFLARAIIDKSRNFGILMLILGVCAAIQLIVLMVHGSGGRPFRTDLRILTAPMLLHTTLLPLLGPHITEVLAAPIRGGIRLLQPYAEVYLIGGGLMLFAIAVAARAQRAAIVEIVGVLWVLVSVLNTIGVSNNANDLISPLDGTRYFLFGSTCFCLLLALGTTADSFARNIAAGLLAIIVINSALERAEQGWSKPYIEGPSWKEGIATCSPGAPCTVPIWPEGWSMKIAPGN